MSYIWQPVFGVVLTAGLLFYLSKKNSWKWILLGFLFFYVAIFAFVGDLTGLGFFFLNALAFLLYLPLFYVPYAIYGAFSKYDSFLYTLIFPTSVVLMEFVATPLRLSPLMNISYRFFYCTPLIQCASLIGSAGLSFIICWFLASGVTMISRKFARKYVWATVISGAVVVAALVFGILRLGNPENNNTRYIKAAWTTGPEMVLVDGVWQLHPYEENLNSFLETSAEAAEKGAELLIYSEESFTLEADKCETFRNIISERAKELHLAMLVGLDEEIDNGRQNVIYYYDAEGNQKGCYVKHMVIPIVEEGYRRGNGKILQSKEEFECGDVKVACAICYDGNFELFARRMDNDAEVYLYPSWDWPAIENMHTMIAGFRAVENGIPLAKVTTHGRSVLYDKYGRILFDSHTDNGYAKVYSFSLPCDNIETFYEKCGQSMDVLLLIFGIVLYALAIKDAVTRKKKGIEGKTDENQV